MGRLQKMLGWWLLTASLAASGCTAFADAVDGGGDGGTPDAGVGLIIEPVRYIEQGEKANYTFQFDEAPPWADLVVDKTDCILTKFKFVNLEDHTEQLLDLNNVTNYCEDGDCDIDIVGALVQAARDADTMTNRLLIMEVAFEQNGKPQQLWGGSAQFWVFTQNGSQDSDGGTDGGGGD